MIQLSQALSELDWIPRPKLTVLRRLGLETVEDLVTHFPREESDTPICLCGEVVKTQLRRFGGWKKIFEATLQESDANALSQPSRLRPVATTPPSTAPEDNWASTAHCAARSARPARSGRSR